MARLFNLFWISGSWQKRFTSEDTEVRRRSLFYSASLSLSFVFRIVPENNNKSQIILRKNAKYFIILQLTDT